MFQVGPSQWIVSVRSSPYPPGSVLPTAHTSLVARHRRKKDVAVNARARNDAPGIAVPVQSESFVVEIAVLGITNRPDVVSRDTLNRLQDIGDCRDVRAGNNTPRCPFQCCI